MSGTRGPAAPPEHNGTDHDYADRTHFRYSGPPILDIHAHVLRTRPNDPPTGPPPMSGPGATSSQAELMIDVAREFGILRTWSMCPPEAIPPLRERLSYRIACTGVVRKSM